MAVRTIKQGCGTGQFCKIFSFFHPSPPNYQSAVIYDKNCQLSQALGMQCCHFTSWPVCQLCCLLPHRPPAPCHCLRWQDHQAVDVQGREETVCDWKIWHMSISFPAGLGSLYCSQFIYRCESWNQEMIKKVDLSDLSLLLKLKKNIKEKQCWYGCNTQATTPVLLRFSQRCALDSRLL